MHSRACVQCAVPQAPLPSHQPGGQAFPFQGTNDNESESSRHAVVTACKAINADEPFQIHLLARQPLAPALALCVTLPASRCSAGPCRWENNNGPRPTDWQSMVNLIDAVPKDVARFVYVTSAGACSCGVCNPVSACYVLRSWGFWLCLWHAACCACMNNSPSLNCLCSLFRVTYGQL